MKQYVRTKIIFTGEPAELKEIVKALASEDGKECISLNRILPLEGAGMEEVWDISSEPEELDWILYRNDTILEYSLDTINKTPLPVFKKLAKMYPDVSMCVKYASEDYGEDCGLYESKEGTSELTAQELDDPLVFACEIWDIDPDEEMQERMINAYEE